MTLWAVLAIVIACVACQAFFAASEIALVAADELKVRAGRELGDKEAALLDRLLERRERIVALMLSGNNLATVIAAAVLTAFFVKLGPHMSFWTPFILAPVSLLLGESIPKMIALRVPLGFARIVARPLQLLATVLAPLLVLETALSGMLRRLVGVPPERDSVFLTREDLATLIHRQPEETVITEDTAAIKPAEGEMIGRILRFTRSEARKVMVPLLHVEAVPDDISLAGVIESVRREGFTRIPVFHKRILNIIGVVHAFDLLEAPDLSRPVREVMRPVSYFPESTPLDEILLALQRTRESLAVVVDEYGAASGILTMEDLLEEVVGNIEDEHDVRVEFARLTSPRTLTVMAQAEVAELNQRFGLKLPEGGEYATIGGLVVERLGHIPKPGEQLKAGDVMITVTRSDARAVRELNLLLDHPVRTELARRA